MASKLPRVVPTCHEGGFGPWFELDWTGCPNHSMAARHDMYTHVNKVMAYVRWVFTVVWAYLTIKCTATRETFFAMAFGIESVILTEVGLLSLRVENYDEESSAEQLMPELDLIEKKRQQTLIRTVTCN
ncbi:hypothetical protein TIFTF001_035193 [Ficus carica]|uniref:Uncharacterized protein n=1 Tax=Ficus carica TaxID=3494 RepID=A0AA88J9R0_FICCA|nr:hypothetical protein TIFTF001_035170 [Ficus carica]GMN66118.1 hypothetical protein TIFTF001_035193 [Ficus carica]